jgi:hypothetical protein
VFSRTTADEPLRRGPVAPPPPASGNRAEAEAALVRGAQDPETGIARLMSPPAARAWNVDGFATVTPGARDDAVDELAGSDLGGAVATSSGRFEGKPAYRASSAFDGDPRRGWIAPWSGRGSAWISWTTPREHTLRELRIERPAPPARAPTRVRLSYPGGRTGPLPVGANGDVALPRPLRARSFKLEVLDAGGGRTAVGIGELRGTGLPARRASDTQVPASCGALTARVGTHRVRLALDASVADLDAGRPLRYASCDGAVDLPAGTAEVDVRGAYLRPLLARLRSAPLVPHAPPTGGGRVVDPGDAGRGSHKGIRVDVSGPSWLVLGESYNRGWTASCDGRDLGAPQVVDAFANGWRVDRGCTDVEFAFAPQRTVTAAYVVGGIACLLLFAALIGAAVRDRRRRTDPTDPDLRDPIDVAVDDAPQPLPIGRAAGWALAIGAACAFAFALRAGAVATPLAFLILWRGVTTRTLILTAGALLAIVVPALYLLFPSQDRGGYNTDYAADHLGAHWVAVAALVLLALALGRTLSTASRRRGGRAAAPPAEGAPRVPA